MMDHQSISVTLGNDSDKPSFAYDKTGQRSEPLTLVTLCPRCDKRVQKEDVVRVAFPPHGDGVWRHTDCDDPKLENADD